MPQIARTNACVCPRTQFWRARAVSGRAVSRTKVRKVVFAMVARADPRSGPALGGAGLALRGELPVQPLKHGVGTVIGTQPQDPAPRVVDHAASPEHDLPHPPLSSPPPCPLA